MRGLRIFVLIICGICGIIYYWLNQGSYPPSARTLVIVTTAEPLESIVSVLAGRKHTLYRLGAEALSESDIGMIKLADIFFLNGLGLGGEPVDQIGQFKRQNAPVIFIGEEAVEENARLRINESPIPYAWTSPRYGSTYADKIVEALVRLDPGGAQQYAQRVELFKKRIAQLDKAIRESLIDVAEAERARLVLPIQMSYLAHDYDLRVIDETLAKSQFSLPYYWDSLPGQPATRERSYFNLLITNALTILQQLKADPRPLKKIDLYDFD